MHENKNKKTTCNKKSVAKVLPAPTAEVVAEIVGVSPSYVKKVRTGARADKSENAELITYCDELLVDGGKVLLKTVSAIIQNRKTQ
jgi:hypothetical protein